MPQGLDPQRYSNLTYLKDPFFIVKLCFNLLFQIGRIVVLGLLYVIIDHIKVKNQASIDEKNWVLVALLLLIVFFSFILIAPFLLIGIVVGAKEPALAKLIISILFSMISFFYEKFIEGIELWHDLPDDPSAYDSLFIHYFRFLLLGIIFLFALVLTYSLFYICLVYCCGYRDVEEENRGPEFLDVPRVRLNR